MAIGLLALRTFESIMGGFRLRDLLLLWWRAVDSGSNEKSFDFVGPNIGERMSMESGGLVGLEESYAASLNTRSYMEPRCESEIGELGREPGPSVVACDQRWLLGTVTDV